MTTAPATVATGTTGGRGAGRGLLFHLSYASVANYVGEAILLVRGFVLASVIGPAAFGIWSSMRLVLMLSRFAHLGARAGMLQLSVRASGAADEDRADHYRGVAWGVNLAGNLVFGAALLGAAAWWWIRADGSALWLGLVALLMVQTVFVFYRAVLHSRRLYGTATSSKLGSTALSTVLGLSGALTLGLPGFLAGLGVSYVVSIAVSRPFGGPFPRPALDRTAASELLGIGFPLMASGLLKTLLWNVDKLLLWAILGKLALGTYSVQAYVTNGLMLFPAAVSQVFYPHLVAQVGKAGRPETASPYLVRGMELMAHAVCPIVALVALNIHFPIRWWLPQYAEAVGPGRVLALASFFPMVAMVAGTVLVALGGHRRQLAISAIAVVVAIGAVGTGLLLGGGLLAAAWGTALGFVTRAALSTFAAVRATRLHVAQIVPMLARTAGAYAVTIAIVVVLGRVIPYAATTWQDDLWRTAGRCALLSLPLVPWTWITVRRARAFLS